LKNFEPLATFVMILTTILDYFIYINVHLYTLKFVSLLQEIELRKKITIL